MASPAAQTTLLVVEDDAPLREFYKRTLQSAGYTTVAVEDGVDALSWLERQTPAVIVLDLSLVRLSGRDLLRELRARPETRHIPIVVVTGADNTDDLLESDIACLLRKPITGGSLIDAVESCLRRHR